jgi:hypothetical protein
MENNYFTPHDMWNSIDCENESNTYLQPRRDPDTIEIPPMPEVDWDLWMCESNLSPQQGLGNVSIVPQIQLTENTLATPLPNLRCNTNFSSQELLLLGENTGYPLAFDDLEQLLFSSTQGLNPTPSPSWHTQATPTLSPTASSNQSGENSPSNSPTTSSTSLSQAQTFSCRFCAQNFAKRHLLNRHEKQHDKPVACPRGCGHHTARNRDMQRHIAVHHSAAQPVSRYLCPVPGCKTGRDGFTRKDNLTRHMKKVHGKVQT